MFDAFDDSQETTSEFNAAQFLMLVSIVVVPKKAAFVCRRVAQTQTPQTEFRLRQPKGMPE